MEIGEKFVENDFFKDFGQKCKIGNGTIVFQKFLSSDGFFNRELTTAVFRSRGTLETLCSDVCVK